VARHARREALEVRLGVRGVNSSTAQSSETEASTVGDINVWCSRQ